MIFESLLRLIVCVGRACPGFSYLTLNHRGVLLPGSPIRSGGGIQVTAEMLAAYPPSWAWRASNDPAQGPT